MEEGVHQGGGNGVHQGGGGGASGWRRRSIRVEEGVHQGGGGGASGGGLSPVLQLVQAGVGGAPDAGRLLPLLPLGELLGDELRLQRLRQPQDLRQLVHHRLERTEPLKHAHRPLYTTSEYYPLYYSESTAHCAPPQSTTRLYYSEYYPLYTSEYCLLYTSEYYPRWALERTT